MKLKSEYKVRKIAGESVIVRMGIQDVKMTNIISLNSTSEWLWEQLQDEEFDAEKVADMLTAEYEVEREVAYIDAMKWIKMLQEADLVHQ
ncbi:MAG: PqqD family protein [Tidjanibacter sp.]|nr:PqqD family protein [Tidjanibacter sp.]